MKLLRYYKDNGELVEIDLSEIESWLSVETKKEELANFIYNRFYYRYIKPFKYQSDNKINVKNYNDPIDEYTLIYKNGFSMMANCCLLIEALESFIRGWENSNRRSGNAFLKFFSRDKNFKEFAVNDIPSIFYKSIRCGILHQGETRKGWRLTRNDKKVLLDYDNKEINVTKFLNKLEQSLKDYKNDLINANWNDEIWKKAKDKLKSIIKVSKE